MAVILPMLYSMSVQAVLCGALVVLPVNHPALNSLGHAAKYCETNGKLLLLISNFSTDEFTEFKFCFLF